MTTFLNTKRTGIFNMIIMLLTIPFAAYAQAPTYKLYVTNELQTAANVYQFDVYLHNTSVNTFELANVAFGLFVDPNIKNGGTITPSYLSGSSQLNIFQTPAPANVTFVNTVNYFNLSARPNPGPGNGSIISTINLSCSSPGTRIGTFIITNSVPFAQNSNCNHIFSTSAASGRANTIVTAYVASSPLNITNTANHLGYLSPGTCLLNIPLNSCAGVTAAINTSTNVNCFGASTGSATATLTGGFPVITYLWSDPGVQTTQTATGLTAGTYTVTVTEGGGCTSTASVTITQPLVALSINESHTDVTCPGDPDGTIDITVSNGTSPYTYSWADGNLNEDRTGLAAGTYTVYVTDQNSCTASKVVTVATTPDVTPPGISCPGPITIDCQDSQLPANTGTATAIDNCDLNPSVSYADQVNAGSCPNSYSITRIWTASDASNNTSTCSQTITVQDVTAPTVSCIPDAALACNATVPEGATNVADFTTAGGSITDNCAGAITVSSSDAVSATGCVETITRTYTVTDACGNSATCDQTITRTVDTQAPTVSCIPDAALACNATVPAGVTNVADFTTAGGSITDNCAGAITVSSIDAVSATGCVETTTRTYTVTDACGNSATCDQTITRTVDTQAPTVSCIPDAALACNATVPAGATNVADFTTAGGSITDNCAGGITVSSSDAVSATGCVETTTRTYTVTDACGNSATCDQTITRTVDTQAPTVSCIPDAALACNATVPAAATNVADFTTAGGSITDNCAGAITVSSSDAVSATGCVETTTRTYTVTDACGNSATCDQTITRTVDTQAPTVSCIPDAALACNATVPEGATNVADFTTAGGSITDNCAGAITVSSIDTVSATGCVETTTRTYTVTDACGNSATCDQTITRTVDTQAPTVSCIPDAALACNATVPAGATNVADFTTAGGSITDNCAGAITVSSIDAVSATGCVETTTRTYTVTDACGNSATCDQTITRTVDTQAPTVSCIPDAALACNATVPAGATNVADFTTAGGSITDNCAGAITVSSIDAVSTTGCVETTTRTYTVTDACGNSATCDQTITRTVDTQAPTVSCIPDAALACNATVPAGATNVADFTTAGGSITDNCAGAITVSSIDAVSATGCVETTTRTYTVTDACGNSATCDQTITRTVDTQAPTVSCIPDAALACNATVPAGVTNVADFTTAGGSITDNCAGAITVSSSDAVSTTGCVETTTRTYTVTDACGNSATCDQTITRTVDTQAPTIICSGDISEPVNNAGCTALISLISPTVNDNCGPPIVSNDAPSVFPLGLTVVTWTTTDACGLTATCIQNVTVTSSLTVSAGSDVAICTGSSTNLTATGASTYTWMPGSLIGAVQLVSPVTTTTYTVTGTDAFGCTKTATVTVMVNPLPTADITETDNSGTTANDGIICIGGSAELTGAGGTSYIWNPAIGAGPGPHTVSPLTTTSYTVIVTDINGCSSTTSITISVNPLPVANPTVIQPLCHNGIGSVIIVGSGGTGPYTDEGNFPVAAGANYSFTVSDANGCESVAVTGTMGNPTQVTASPTATNAGCTGTGGTVNSNPSGGTGSYSFLWSTGATTQNITNRPAGTYTVTVTDSNGCSATGTGIVGPNVPITISGVVTNIVCRGINTGEIDITAGGGVPGYTYLWNGGNTNEDRTNLAAGTYTVTVKDALLCTKTATFIVTQPATTLVLNTSQTNVRCFGASTGIAAVSPAGGSIPYAYSWNTFPVNTNSSLSGLPAGPYTCTVTDGNNCTKTVTIIILENPLLVVVPTQTNVTFPGGSNGTASVSVSGGVAPYTYAWNTTPTQTTTSITGLTAGVYKCTVTDNKGCNVKLTFTITEPIAKNTMDEDLWKVSISPNPSEGIVWLGFESANEDNYVISLSDLTGKILYEKSMDSSPGDNQFMFDFSQMAKGVYVMKISGGDHSKMIRLVLQ